MIKTDICIIGAGSGGLSVAAGAAQMGARTVLIEKDRMGGDCLNYGCVPSKAIIAAARRAGRGDSEHLGVTLPPAEVDFAAVHHHIHSVIGRIEPHDSVERFEGLGVTVLKGEATFVDHKTVRVGEELIRARRFVIATGSRPAVPVIPGLDETPFLTNETVFDLRDRPEHLIVVGGGPIGSELSQAFRRLGCEVTMIEARGILGRDDPALVEVVRSQLLNDGIRVLENTSIERVSYERGNFMVETEAGKLQSSHLMVATGRKPNIEELDLQKAGISISNGYITVDERLRTANRKVFAIGDVTGGFQFTHIAGYEAGIVIRNALFRLPAKAVYNAVPWVTYTDPELANVGLSEQQARARHGKDVSVLTWPFDQNDRAMAEGDTRGLIKVVLGKHGSILGAAIVGVGAGDLIQPWTLAINQKLKIGAMATPIVPYPTRGEISKRVAGEYFTPLLYGKRTKAIVRFLSLFG